MFKRKNFGEELILLFVLVLWKIAPFKGIPLFQPKNFN